MEWMPEVNMAGTGHCVPSGGAYPCDQAHNDCDGYAVENFGWPRNLMLVHACHFVSGDAQSCIQAIGRFYQSIDAEKRCAIM